MPVKKKHGRSGTAATRLLQLDLRCITIGSRSSLEARHYRACSIKAAGAINTESTEVLHPAPARSDSRQVNSRLFPLPSWPDLIGLMVAPPVDAAAARRP
jgi:hypothetical protein